MREYLFFKAVMIPEAASSGIWNENYYLLLSSIDLLLYDLKIHCCQTNCTKPSVNSSFEII